MELVFDRRGTGEPLVLLHGIGSRWQVFAPMLDLLAAHHEVWTVDLPGFGASPPMPAGRRADIEGLTDGLAEWMSEQGLEHAHVAGNSTGGGIALELAARGTVASATGLAPIGFWSRRERAWCQGCLRLDRTLFGIAGGLAKPALSTPLSRKLLLSQTFVHGDRLSHEEAMDTVAAFMDAVSFDETLAAFTGYVAPANAADDVPVTIVWGDRDYLLLSRQARRAQRLLPRARHVMVESAGHVLMNDAPEACVEAILATTRSGRGPRPRGISISTYGKRAGGQTTRSARDERPGFPPMTGPTSTTSRRNPDRALQSAQPRVRPDDSRGPRPLDENRADR